MFISILFQSHIILVSNLKGCDMSIDKNTPLVILCDESYKCSTVLDSLLGDRIFQPVDIVDTVEMDENDWKEFKDYTNPYTGDVYIFIGKRDANEIPNYKRVVEELNITCTVGGI